MGLHELLVDNRVNVALLVLPGEVLVGVVGLERLGKNHEALAVLGDLGPVTVDIGKRVAEVAKGALVDLAVNNSVKVRVDFEVLLPRLLGLRNDKVGGFLARTHKGLDALRVGLQKVVVANVQDGAEAAATKLSELVNAKHLDIVTRAALRSEPLGQLDHLDILQTNTSVNGTIDDGLGDVHAATDSSVVIGSHAIVSGKLVDLNLAKLTHISNALALERLEVSSDSRVLEVNDTSERLVKQGSNGGNGITASFASQGVDHGLETQVNLARTNELSHVRGIVGLHDGNLESLFLEESLGVGEVNRGMVRGGTPVEKEGNLVGPKTKQLANIVQRRC